MAWHKNCVKKNNTEADGDQDFMRVENGILITEAMVTDQIGKLAENKAAGIQMDWVRHLLSSCGVLSSYRWS